MTGEAYQGMLDQLAGEIAAAEERLRRAAAKAPNVAGREDALASADGLSAERRRLRAAMAREAERVLRPGQLAPAILRERVEIGELAIDPITRRVSVAGEEVHLAAKEYELLRALAAEPTRVWTKDELLRTVWGFKSPGRTRTVDSHASRLRRKLNGSPTRHFVRNIWGVGYRLVDDIPEVVAP